MVSNNERTRRAERITARLAAMPLMEEAVFHSLRFQDRNVEKEACDIVLLHRGEAILLSLKAQDAIRDATQTARWLGKHARKALGQLRGAYRTLRERASWCDHPIHGPRAFPANSIRPRHGVALLETEFEVALGGIEPHLRETDEVIPTSLMSVQNFVSVLHYLRTWRDLLQYLEARRTCLRSIDRYTVGADIALLGYYTAMRDVFDGCGGIADAKIVTARGEHVRSGAAFRDREVALAGILEDSMRGIATSGNLVLPADSEHLRAHFSEGRLDRDGVREELCELSIQERAALGEQIGVLCGRVGRERSAAPVYGGVRFTRHPTKSYLIIVAWNADHAELGVQALDLTIAGCVYYQRSTGITLALNQLGEHVQFNWYRVANIQPSVEMLAVGQKYFGHIRPRAVVLAR